METDQILELSDKDFKVATIKKVSHRIVHSFEIKGKEIISTKKSKLIKVKRIIQLKNIITGKYLLKGLKSGVGMKVNRISEIENSSVEFIQS